MLSNQPPTICQGSLYKHGQRHDTRELPGSHPFYQQEYPDTPVAYLSKEGGTRSPQLCALTRQVLTKCDLHSINLRPAYLPGIANVEADGLSRGKELQEWTLSRPVVLSLFRRWGRPFADLFASREAHLLPRYFTLDRTDKRAIGCDAFLTPWTKPLYLAFPPPQLLCQVLGKLHRDRTSLILIAPDWKDASW